MKFLFSSIGKKIQMAISGILFCIFLLFHLFNNLVLFAGSDTFNQMVSFLESIKPIIRFMEFGLLFILLIVALFAIIIFLNKLEMPAQQELIKQEISNDKLIKLK